MKKKILAVLAIAIAGGVIWFAISTSRLGYETARYETTSKDGSFEIRNYPDLKTVATSSGEGSNNNGEFGRLFRFITGNNESEQKIAMTTPVFMPGSREGKPSEMHFVLPETVSENGAPEPKAQSVSLKKITGGTYAVLRFNSDPQSDAGRKAALERLLTILESRKLNAMGEPLFAYYDPPWTPGFLRRNEVLLEIEE